MKILVVGAGVIGTTTAYDLRRRGHDVTVIDRQEGPGRETSLANGALVTPSMPEPWNAPGSWRVLLGSIGRSDAPLQVSLKALPSLAGWGIRFLMNSRAAAFERNTVSNLRLALYSLEALQSLREETRIDYPHGAPGTLRLFRDPAAIDRAAAWAEHLSRHGLSARRLSRSETIQVEPALAPIADQLAGAIRYETDETGDAYHFCTALAAYARECGVEFRFSTEVSSIDARCGKVAAVLTTRERLDADCCVVAACSYSPQLVRSLGVHLPVRPVKGHSVTFTRLRGELALRIPIVDDDLHAVVVPIGDALRVAGTADFTGYDLTPSAARIENLLRLIQKILPQSCYDSASAHAWCGLRAMSVDGVPLIGPTHLPNLFLSTGHGHLGWTMTAGSAQLLTDLISRTPPHIDPAPYDPRRFG